MLAYKVIFAGVLIPLNRSIARGGANSIMGSKDRMIRAKDKLRSEILCTALDLMNTEGPASVSLRKIADRIEYTAPIIYSCFKNKQAILVALANTGYELMNEELQNNCPGCVDPEERLRRLLITVWTFARSQPQLYNLMYECGICSQDKADDFPGLLKFFNFLKQTIAQTKGGSTFSNTDLQCKAYSAAALMHGLVSASIFWKTDAKLSIAMRDDMIASFIGSLR